MIEETNTSSMLCDKTTWSSANRIEHIARFDIINLTLHGLFGVFGVFVNSLTIAVALRGRRFARSLKIQIVNLALVELLCSLLTPTSGFIRGIVTISYPNSRLLCIAQQYVTVAIYSNSLYCKVGIALERFMAVYYPLKMLNYTEFHTTVVVIVCWILSSILYIDLIMDSGVYTIPELENIRMCISENKKKELVWICITIGRFFAPVLLLLVSYSAVAVKFTRATRIGETRSSSHEQRRNRRILIMLALVSVITIISWLPCMAPSLISHFQSRETTQINLPSLQNMLFYLLMLTNCFSTNIVYLVFSKDYRADVKLVFYPLKTFGQPQQMRRISTVSRLPTLTTQTSNDYEVENDRTEADTYT